ncbi:nestin [Conger conger]|uniref:nestin n=1 Tax=Conger conger TaxID=82655 RepID=UPI002A5A1B0E|nr:nestin [Conger conger]
MEIPGIRHSRGHLGSEKQQMLDLNKRLEMYLSRVKLLEEENELLKEEIHALQGSRKPQAWRGELDGQLRRARGEVEAAWMERDRVELVVANLSEDLQTLQLRRQKEAATQAEVKKSLTESKKEMEEERRAQIWLREKVAQLEKELQFQLEIHQEEVSALQARLSHARPVLMSPPHTEALHLQDLGQEYSQRASQVWQEAATAYQAQVKRLEDTLSQTRDHLGQVTQEKREGNLMVQCLAKDLDGARTRKKLLEQKLSQQRSSELKELELLQAHLESLEGEKAKMSEQISDILDDRQSLLQLKMSLGMEVATYRALLDNESLRVDKPSINNPWGSITVDGGPSLRGFKQRLQATHNGSHIASPVSSKLGKRTQATVVAKTVTPVQMSKQDTSEHKPKSAGFTEEQEQAGWSEESSLHAIWSSPHPKDILKGNGSMEHFREKEVQEEVSPVAALLATRSLELNAAASPIEKCSIDPPAAGGSDVSREEMREKEEYSLSAEVEKPMGLNDTEPKAEQHSAACHSTVFDIPSQFHPEIQAPGSPKVMLNLSGAEPNQSSEDCEDVGVQGSEERAPESAHAPVFAWGEKEDGKEEIEWAEGKTPEFEENKINVDSEIAVISADEDAIMEIDGNPGDSQQEQTSLDAEQLDFSEDGDDSQHASHSWQTEGGELDNNGSYSLENTLADTRPLIRYKSDETDMNTQASQLGDSDSSGDEGNDDKGCWGDDKRRVITSKSIDFMEDLDEEVEKDTEKEEAAGELFQGEGMDAASSPTGERIIFTNDDDDESEREEGIASSQDETTHVTGPTDPMTDPVDKSSEEENGGHGYVQEKDSLSLYSIDDLKGETVDYETALGLQTEYPKRETETESLHPLDSVNSIREMSSQSHSDTQEEAIRSHSEALAPLFSGTVEISATQHLSSNEGTGEGVHSEEAEVLTDRKEGQSLSMLTNVDFTDELSLHSELSSTMGSIINTANSDIEEYSSGDDSPNVSQFLQPITQEEVCANQEEPVARIVSEGKGESAGHSPEFSDPHPENITEEVADHRTESDVILQDQGDIVESPSARLWGHESFVQSVEKIAECSQMVLHNEGNIDMECATEEKLMAVSQPSGDSPNIISDEEDGIFKVMETEVLPQTNGKCHDPHNLLSTNLHEDTWSSSKKKEATYNPQESLVFGVSWEDTENLLVAGEHTEGNLEMSQAPSLAEQKQIPVQLNQLSGAKMEVDGSHSDDSLDEGDSWSSGE